MRTAACGGDDIVAESELCGVHSVQYVPTWYYEEGFGSFLLGTSLGGGVPCGRLIMAAQMGWAGLRFVNCDVVCCGVV